MVANQCQLADRQLNHERFQSAPPKGCATAHLNRWKDAHEINRLVVGARFKVNKLGAAHCPALAGKTGTVAEISHSNTGVGVLFDGIERPTYLHRDFITPSPAMAELIRLALETPVCDRGLHYPPPTLEPFHFKRAVHCRRAFGAA